MSLTYPFLHTSFAFGLAGLCLDFTLLKFSIYAFAKKVCSLSWKLVLDTQFISSLLSSVRYQPHYNP